MKLNRIEILILSGMITIKLLFHFLIAGNYELHRDALLYAALGDHPAWGYASVPPLIGVIANLSRFLFGDTAFALRFFPAIMGALSIWIIILIIKEMKGGAYAVFLGALAYLFSVAYLRTNSLFQPVVFNQFFWLLSFFLLVKMIRTSKPEYWLLIGLTWGLGALNKYSIAFLALGIVSGILISRQRKLLFSWFFLGGMVLGLLIFMPNLIWQYRHNWPVIHHMAELQESQLVNVELSGFLVGQLIMNVHALVVWLAGLLVFFLHQDLRKFRPVAYTYLIVILLLILLRGKAYYTLGLYTILFASGALAFDLWTRSKYRFIRIFIPVLLILTALPFVPYSAPLLEPEELAVYVNKTKRVIGDGLVTWEDGKVYDIPQDFADMRGWKQLSDKTEQAWKTLEENQQKKTVIFAGNYGMAGAIQFYSTEKGLPQPHSFNDNYVFWAPETANLEVLIYIDYDAGHLDQYFEEIELFDRVKDKYFRENGLGIFICRYPQNRFREFYRERVHETKSRYQRN